jgi:hypothetical protein
MNRQHEVVPKVSHLVSLCAGLVAAGVFLWSGSATAQNITMNNGGSTATLNVGGGTGSIGMNSWSVDTMPNVNQLNQQWFWYSVNGAPQKTIDQISAATVYNFSNPSTPIDNIGVVYQNSQLNVQIQYILSGFGSGSGNADMQEYLSIVNNSASSISLSFYQYSNFNLFQDNQNTVGISGGPGAYTGALQTTATLGGNGIAEVIDAPYANFAEAASAYQTVNALNSGSYYTLNGTTSAGPGDVTWAFEWTATLAPNGQNGDTLDITKDKGLSIRIVPEPSTLALIALGMGALGLSLRRKLS